MHIITDYRMCTRCVMDTNADPQKSIKANGECERCNIYESSVSEQWNHGCGHETELKAMISKIKRASLSNKYDCSLVFPVALIRLMFCIRL